MSFNPYNFVSTVRPDEPDLRDRIYNPTLKVLPAQLNNNPASPPKTKWVKNQGQTMACTGFALSSMVERLLRIRDTSSTKEISEHMLYYMARLYDEIPGENSNIGSTARGAMKAWHRHGACERSMWQTQTTEPNSAEKDWQTDAFRTPLGAYYRVDHSSLADMHAAINETGVIYVTAQVHQGWQNPSKPDGIIQYDGSQVILGGHAFLIVGYDEHGFWIQNSWGTDWAKNGFAHLSYADWHANSMDAWIGQLGVTISSVIENIGSGLDYNLCKAGVPPEKSMLSSNSNISTQQINHYVIDLENNGKLSNSGSFWTTPEDIEKLLHVHLQNAIKQWNLGDKEPINVALYAHGGLTPEEGAAQTAKFWLPALYANKIFPVFFMWETGLKDTLGNIIKDKLFGTAAAPQWWSNLMNDELMDERMEGLLSKPGTLFWDQMKQNAYAASIDLTDRTAMQESPQQFLKSLEDMISSEETHISKATKGGLAYLKDSLSRLPESIRKRLRLHLIGHSAGAIFHAYLLKHLVAGLNVEGIYFMAPACRVSLFQNDIWPYLGSKVKSYTQYSLVDRVEQDDNCHPLPYEKSLLYLVSNSFERGKQVPILGMQKFAETIKANRPSGIATYDFVESPSPAGAAITWTSLSTSHGGFDNDQATRDNVIARILQSSTTKPLAGTGAHTAAGKNPYTLPGSHLKDDDDGDDDGFNLEIPRN